MTFENQMQDAAMRERNLAQRLIAQEADGDQSPLGMVAATERAFERLYRHLSVLIGIDGFDVLAKRSLYLATLEYPFLVLVTTESEADRFHFHGLTASIVGRQPAEVDAGIIAILGYFFWLLVTFVGDALFHRLVRGVWSDAIIDWKEPGGEETPA